ncbi:regulatory protein RecX [Anaerobranca gottschalkii]|uniref:Regulatory protein RecX n=1 Tax=Anaerobranca gottschalkii DSM 13577 TaxID=1120990 RepID=A0A1H9Z8W3_9FIRM|nr:RecX family transcriptional regulator [Anaerobranca gottschalkii]SES77507.1 regulatory protein [Anaerobranca gottschalkii DSM 13577]
MLEKGMSLALKYLSYRGRTEYEIQKYLEKKGFDDEIITAVIDKLKEYNYINDMDYIANFHKNQTKSKGNGPIKIQYILQQKGISKEKYHQIEQKEKTDYYSIALEQGKKKLKGKKDINSLRKTYAFLLRKGFPMEVVSKVINNLKEEE